MSDWRERAACRDDDPNQWDLDVIGDDTQAIIDCLDVCRACPVIAECGAWLDSMTRHTRPREVVMAGRVLTYNNSRTRRVTGICRHGIDKTREVCAPCESDRRRNRALAQQKTQKRREAA